MPSTSLRTFLKGTTVGEAQITSKTVHLKSVAVSGRTYVEFVRRDFDQLLEKTNTCELIDKLAEQ